MVAWEYIILEDTAAHRHKNSYGARKHEIRMKFSFFFRGFFTRQPRIDFRLLTSPIQHSHIFCARCRFVFCLCCHFSALTFFSRSLFFGSASVLLLRSLNLWIPTSLPSKEANGLVFFLCCFPFLALDIKYFFPSPRHISTASNHIQPIKRAFPGGWRWVRRSPLRRSAPPWIGRGAPSRSRT